MKYYDSDTVKNALLQDADTNASLKLDTSNEEFVSVTLEEINKTPRLFYLISWIIERIRRDKHPQIGKLVVNGIITGFLVTTDENELEVMQGTIIEYLNLWKDRTGEELDMRIDNIGEIKHD